MVAAVLGWGAVMLPWASWTVFAVITTVVAVVHGLTAALALLGHPLRVAMWRAQAWASLTYLGYLTWNLVSSAYYVAVLYGGLGKGVAVALGLVWLIVVALTVPLSAWGLVASGGVRRTRGTAVGGVLGLVSVLGGLASTRAAAAADPSAPVADHTRASLRDRLAEVVPEIESLPRGSTPNPSLMTVLPAVCEHAPRSEEATVIATFLTAGVAGRPEVTTRCIQTSTLEEALARLADTLQTEALRGRIKIDVVKGVQPLAAVVPVVDSLLLRPGLDGVCEQGRCLAPWQLVATDQYTRNLPVPVIPDLRFGFSATAIRKLLAEPTRRGPIPAELDGLVRIETHSYVTDDAGVLHALVRMRQDGPELDAQSLARGLAGAERYILDAMGPDGRFAYRVQPFTGRISHSGFSLARQAGTTLVICELGRDPRVVPVATSALRMLADTQIRVGDLAMLAYPKQRERERVGLGNTALASIAFLSCRDRVGNRFDEDIAAMARFLLAMQREDGSFYPEFGLRTGAPVPGPDPLYAVGQAVFALTLLEELTADPEGRGVTADLPAHEEVREAVERAMEYVARDYWNVFVSDFFFMEENWHCLAARAALGHHRHDGYERFCLDYVRYKTRLILDETSEVDPDLVGGYGFGNVLLPHNTGSSGFGEAMAAAMAIQRARDESTAEGEAAMRRVLAFLLHHQWNDVACFACTQSLEIPGAFSEHMASPSIRIDYVQHAMAALGHGGRMLGLVEHPRD